MLLGVVVVLGYAETTSPVVNEGPTGACAMLVSMC